MICPGDGDPRHGTVNGYANLGCRCESCRAAVRTDPRTKARLVAWRRRNGVMPLAERRALQRRHPSISQYNKGCRCDGCRAISRTRRREYRARKKAAS